MISAPMDEIVWFPSEFVLSTCTQRKHSCCTKIIGVFVCWRSGGYFQAFWGSTRKAELSSTYGKTKWPSLTKTVKSLSYKWSLTRNTKAMETLKCQPLEARISCGIVNLVAMEGKLEKSGSRDIGEDGNLILNMFIAYKSFPTHLAIGCDRGRRGVGAYGFLPRGCCGPGNPPACTPEPFSPLNTVLSRKCWRAMNCD